MSFFFAILAVLVVGLLLEAGGRLANRLPCAVLAAIAGLPLAIAWGNDVLGAALLVYAMLGVVFGIFLGIGIWARRLTSRP